MALAGSGTLAGVTMIVTSPLTLLNVLTIVDPGPLISKLKNVLLPSGSTVGIGVPPVPVPGS